MQRLFGYDQGVMGGLLDLPSFVSPIELQKTLSIQAKFRRRQSSPNLILRLQLRQPRCLTPPKEYTDQSSKVRLYSNKGYGPQAINKISGISVAAYNVGCFFGAIACIFIGNPLGRRKMIFLGSSIMVVGAAIQSSSFGLPQFITGRLITGYEPASPSLRAYG